MRTLVVTGASSGLGRHIALKAREAGFNVIGLARRSENDGGLNILPCDITDAAQVKAAFKKIRKAEGLYALINAAGIASMNLFVLTPTATMERIVATNLLGTMYCSAEMGRLLARQKGGRIIGFSTIAVNLALKGEVAYGASKAGVEGFTRAFAREMADHNVTVNAIAPGPIDTALIAGVPHDKIDQIVAQQTIPEKATPDDVWATVALLLDERSKSITGEILNINGAA